ncbi:hypothetical protein [Tranquillimonas alkanivorans]|uniref:Uncharacterized protein n=1 Tax=Tranquillimonas alkanivorans TaxID=441119 RepID=A0A1I5UJ19_9RHOB|nr:hypothetical protein [Tranquillimonas alkanivorans]SFP95291.1 hypothetical protein SAMN04488047_12118 [Tranquillimonas alkanivorans]
MNFGSPKWRDQIGGFLMVANLLTTIPYQFTGFPALSYIAGAFALCGLAAFGPQVAMSRRVFLLIGALLTVIAVSTLPNWDEAIFDALTRASSIAALFCALLRSSALFCALLRSSAR